jgi:DNA polymerase (family 10)
MVENSYISKIFDEIAFFLKLKSENIYKIRSYEKVRDVIMGMDENLENYWRKGGDLKKIEGVGEAIEKKIIDIIETGDCNLHRRLIAEFPVTLLELKGIKGLTIKLIKKLYEQFGIKSLSELKAFLQTEESKNLKELQKIRKNIEGL